MAGFLKQLILHAIFETYAGKTVSDNVMVGLEKATFDRLFPGFGQQAVSLLASLKDPKSQFQRNYRHGQRESKNYVAALRLGDQQLMTNYILRFREYVIRSHLGMNTRSNVQTDAIGTSGKG